MANRRRSERYDVTIPVVIKGPRGAEQTLTSNVSAHGIAIFTDKMRPLRQYVEIELALPGGTKTAATAMVIRNTDRLIDRAGLTHPGLAFDFYLFESEGRSSWSAFIAGLSGRNSLAPPKPPPELESTDPTTTFLINPPDRGRLWAFFRGEMAQRRARIESPVVKPAGTPVELLIVHPDSDAEWSIFGSVVAASKHGRGRGPMLDIEMFALDRAGLENFKTFISTGRRPLDEGETADAGAPEDWNEQVQAASDRAEPEEPMYSEDLEEVTEGKTSQATVAPKPRAAIERPGTFAAFFDEFSDKAVPSGPIEDDEETT